MSKFSSHLQGVRTAYFGQHILESVGPLVEAVEGLDSVPAHSNAACAVEAD